MTDINQTPPETGSDVNITVNEGVEPNEAPETETETPAEEAPSSDEDKDASSDSE